MSTLARSALISGMAHEAAAPRMGCPALQRTPRCAAHARRKRDTRPSAHARSYGGAWRSLRAQVLAAEPRCRRCGAPSKHADHIVPRSRGGRDVRSNLQGLCASCHGRVTALVTSSIAIPPSARAVAAPSTRGTAKLDPCGSMLR